MFYIRYYQVFCVRVIYEEIKDSSLKKLKKGSSFVVKPINMVTSVFCEIIWLLGRQNNIMWTKLNLLGVLNPYNTQAPGSITTLAVHIKTLLINQGFSNRLEWYKFCLILAVNQKNALNVEPTVCRVDESFSIFFNIQFSNTRKCPGN